MSRFANSPHSPLGIASFALGLAGNGIVLLSGFASAVH